MHYMHLNAVPFKEIKEGTKTIEIRLNDEKRQKLSIGDLIEFTNRETEEKIRTKILDLKKYKTYVELVNDTPIEAFGPRFKSKEELLKKGAAYYAQDEQDKYGFLCIYLSVQE